MTPVNSTARPTKEVKSFSATDEMYALCGKDKIAMTELTKIANKYIDQADDIQIVLEQNTIRELHEPRMLIEPNHFRRIVTDQNGSQNA